MNTITKTTAAAVSRKLNSLGFEKYDRWLEAGYSVMQDMDCIEIANWTYSPGTAASELAAAGYVITNVRTSKREYAERYVEIFTVQGRVTA
jgi:hypothetical protein